MGRPKLPKGEAKGAQVGVRFKPEDEKLVDKASADSRQTKADYVRNAAIADAKKRPVWVRSKWTMKELDGKTVEFSLIAPGEQHKGTGKFLVRQNPDGKLSIEICATLRATLAEVTEIRYNLHQLVADLLKVHPDPNKAQFLLLM